MDVNNIPAKRGPGAPSLLTPALMQHITELVDKLMKTELAGLVLTDEDILDEINDSLPPEKQINLGTFQSWIVRNTAGFASIIKKTRNRARRNLINQLRNETKSWQRFAWILERKFPEFNLKQISEVHHKIEPININLNIAPALEQPETITITSEDPANRKKPKEITT